MIVVVPNDFEYVVERLGRYQRTLSAGLHVLVPVLDRVAFRYALAPAEEEVTETAITLDNIPVRIALKCRWQITDAKSAAYESANVQEFVSALVRTAAREWASARSMSDLRETTRELRIPAAQSGVKVIGVDVVRIDRVT